MYRGPGSAMPCVLSFDYLRLAGHRNRVRAYTDSSPTCKKNVSYFLILFFFCFLFFFSSLHFVVVVVFETIRYISSGLAAPIESWGFEFRVFFFLFWHGIDVSSLHSVSAHLNKENKIRLGFFYFPSCAILLI